jgi:hypothetical protein
VPVQNVKRSVVVRWGSIAWAIQPAERATAKIASPAPVIIPATFARAASAKSTLGSVVGVKTGSSLTLAATP